MHMDFNDIIQWVAVAAILIIVFVVVVRKLLRLRRRLRKGGSAGCGCGCQGCEADCSLRDAGRRDSDHCGCK